MERIARRCLFCSGTTLLAGSSIEARPFFRIPGLSWWQPGSNVAAKPFACMQCGGVSYFLADEDLQRIRAAYEEQPDARADS
jgi:hypothetical protein